MTILLVLTLVLQDDLSKKLDALAVRIASEDAAERARGKEELKKLIDADRTAARKALKVRLATEKDPEVKGVLETALIGIPVLELSIQVDGQAKVGQPVKFKVRIKNVSDEDQVVVGSLDGSDDGQRYPKYVFSSDQVVPHAPGKRFCGNCNEIVKENVKILKPGEDFDPFGPGSYDKPLSWKPSRAGNCQVILTWDYAANDVRDWNGPIERNLDMGDLKELLKRVPQVKLEAKVKVDVKE